MKTMRNLILVLLLVPALARAAEETAPLTRSELLDIQENLAKTSDLLSQAQREVEQLKDLERQATTGDAKSQCGVGVLYLRGQEFIRKDSEKARMWLEKAAEQGNARATFFLGTMYHAGLGVKKDTKKALELFQKAADAGDSWGEERLAMSYDDGQELKKDRARALKLYLQSAEQGNRLACFNLGVGYQTGKFGKKDFIEAAKWFKNGTQQDEPFCLYGLGALNYAGVLGTTNYRVAAIFFLRAAGQGVGLAQEALARMFFNGWGVPKDLAEAYKWALVAENHGEEGAQRLVRDIEQQKQVTKEALIEGRNRAKAYGQRSPLKHWGDD